MVVPVWFHGTSPDGHRVHQPLEGDGPILLPGILYNEIMESLPLSMISWVLGCELELLKWVR